MKNLLLILTLLFTSLCFGQDKIVKIPQSELEGFFLAIDTLEQQDSLKTILISDLELQINNLNILNLKNDTIILNKNHTTVLINNTPPHFINIFVLFMILSLNCACTCICVSRL